MKTYVKAQVVAKNNPEGSYAAGCPAKDSARLNPHACKACERTQ